MSNPHYVVRRSRMGRFNFTLLSGFGRLTGSVFVSTDDKNGEDIKREAAEKIRMLAVEFVGTSSFDTLDSTEATGPDCELSETND